MSATVALIPQRKLWRVTIVGLLLALGGISLPFGTWDGALTGVGPMAANELVYWGLVVAVLFYVICVERRPLSSIGFRKPGVADILLAIATGALIVAMLAVMYLVVLPALHWNETQQLQTLTTLPLWLRCLSVIRAAVSEELLFRGYALERTWQLTGSRAVAGVFTWSVFTLDHLSYWGWHHLLIAGLAGAALTVFYLWRRNLWASMLAHFIVDAVGFLLG
jgi:membrane protease YdiL (CAAX protease family)